MILVELIDFHSSLESVFWDVANVCCTGVKTGSWSSSRPFLCTSITAVPFLASTWGHLSLFPQPFLVLCSAFFFFFFNFLNFWLCWVFVAARGLSLVASSGGCSLFQCVGFSLQWLLLLQSTGSRPVGFSSCGSRALERSLSSCGAWA